MVAPSHTTSSLPRLWRSNCRKKATTVAPVNACSWLWVNSRLSAVTPPGTDRWSRVSGARKPGVCPRGAYVRATQGRA